MKKFEVSFEISGPTAMWTRPDTGDAPVSYPAPTFSAVKGMFESILWLQSAEVVPTRVEICMPLVYHTYTTNYGGPLRKSGQIAGYNSYQLFATVLINVCYRLYAEIRSDHTGNGWYKHSMKVANGASNGAHAYQQMFERRLNKGQFFSIPCLGWKEFVPDYVGPFRRDTSVCQDINFVLPSMLRTVFTHGKNSERKPKFDQNVTIVKGALKYA